MDAQSMTMTCVICGGPLPPGRRQSQRRLCDAEQCRVEARRASSRRWKERKRHEAFRGGEAAVTCAMCGQPFQRITATHLRTHGISVREYQARFPEAVLCNERIGRSLGLGAARRAKYLTYGGREPDARLFELLTGSLLGDATLSNAHRRLARYTEGSKNQMYLAWKRDILAAYFPVQLREHVSRPHAVTGKRYRGYWLKTGVHPLLAEWHAQWYVGCKTVPRALVEKHLTAFALAVWFCDDGSVQSHGLDIYTMAFAREDVQWLAELLLQRFNLHATVLFRGHKQPFLRVSSRDKERLQKLVAVYEIPGMEYKYRTRPKVANRQLRAVEQLDQDGTVIAQFPSQTAAAKAIGVSLGAIRGALRRAGISGGHHWRYAATAQ